VLNLKRYRNQLIAVCFLFLLVLPFFSYLNNPALNTLKYPVYLLNLVKRELTAIVMFHHNMVENERLARNQDKLIQQIVMFRELEAENKRLKMILDFKERKKAGYICARVISKDSSNLVSSIIIDKGKNSGITNGMSVVTHLGLVGRVAEVDNSVSKIILVNDPNLYVPAIIERSRVQGLVSGRLKDYLVMQYVAGDQDIMPKDIVVTSGIAAEDVKSYYPKDIPVGIVEQVMPDMHGTMFLARIKPFVDLNSLEEVLIIKR